MMTYMAIVNRVQYAANKGIRLELAPDEVAKLQELTEMSLMQAEARRLDEASPQPTPFRKPEKSGREWWRAATAMKAAVVGFMLTVGTANAHWDPALQSATLSMRWATPRRHSNTTGRL